MTHRFLWTVFALSLVLTRISWAAAARGEPTTAPRPDDAAARAMVQKALLRQCDGDFEQRRRLLQAALQVSPDLAPAHWHVGHVKVEDRWVSVAAAERLAADSKLLATYRQLRSRLSGEPRRELMLARWCQRMQWADLARLHYARLLNRSAADQRIQKEAMRKLGLRPVGGMLLTDEEIEYQQQVADQVEGAQKKWRSRLEAWKKAIEGRSAAKREFALGQLEAIDDPAIISVLESLMTVSGPVFGRHVVEKLGSFPQHESTETLVRYAILSPWPKLRQQATSQLGQRPLHDFVPMLLDGLSSPITSRYRISRDRAGNLRYQHLFFQENADADYVLAREHVAQVRPEKRAELRARRLGLPDPGVPVGTPLSTRQHTTADEKREAFRSLVEAVRRERTVAQNNAAVMQENSPIFAVLEKTTEAAVNRHPAQWQLWWQDFNETQANKQTYYQSLPSRSAFSTTYQVQVVAGHSCFAAGTRVWTETGRAPIEQIEVGDRVLSQDPETGELAYKVVLETTASPPIGDLLNVIVDGESIDMTAGHVAWVFEKGWRMAKRLNEGDRVHALHGGRTVDATRVLPPTQRVYNLIVSDFNTYFVGNNGIFVHDITFRKPTRAIVPGLVGEHGSYALGQAPRNLHRQLRAAQSDFGR